MLKRTINLIILFVFLTGCANFLTTTATSGTRFDMKRESVMRVIERKKYKIISQDENTIVVEGMQEQMEIPAIKTFTFKDGRLISVSDQPLDGRGNTFIFAK